MKKILLLSAILFSLQSIAQEPYYDFRKFKEKMNSDLLLPQDRNKQSEILSKDSLEKLLKSFEQKQYSPNFGELALVQPNGDKIYTLSQDNMPCLVPDLSRTNYNMPILMNGKKITGMPPGSAPHSPLLVPKTNKKPLQ